MYERKIISCKKQRCKIDELSSRGQRFIFYQISDFAESKACYSIENHVI